ncbi:hypothetical protein HUG10_17655 [Halorarum halophilum]|uniref:Uncharacterized protein n=1 Tax=Halorarum halophilum TaxID=2743090 RepID=A0A7D5GND3_9EURY|nr:hypothetical protein [Halobaculum halophilum]QLG29244.1 hypothetical protein HUG10_17655 [Halobaculum halophilum]
MPDDPEKQSSDEVDVNQIQQARTEGEAYQTSVTYMAETVETTFEGIEVETGQD